MYKALTIFLLAICLLASCQEIKMYEHHTNLSSKGWLSSDSAKGSFYIDDTISDYRLYVVIRHKDAYQFNNIWLNVGLAAPSDTMYMQKINFSLGTDATGWEGVGMGDIWELRKPLNDLPQQFRKSGTYYYSISQIMRENPLQGVMSVGLRIEKL
jgi:gliding motility-associated lipoprotein GldH